MRDAGHPRLLVLRLNGNYICALLLSYSLINCVKDMRVLLVAIVGGEHAHGGNEQRRQKFGNVSGF